MCQLKMNRAVMGVLAAVAVFVAPNAFAWEGSLSSSPTLVFEGVTSLAELDNYVLGGVLGGSWMSPAKDVQAAVLDSESEDARTYQMQVNDDKGSNDCHLKVCFVEFTVGEGGVYARQTSQGYVSNRGPQLIGQKLVTSGGGYTFSVVSGAQYTITSLTLSDYLTATISGDTAWADIAWEGGKAWTAGPARLSGEGTVTVTDDIGATKIFVTQGNLKFAGSNAFASEIIVQGGTASAPLAFTGKITVDEGAVYDVAPPDNRSNAANTTFVLNGGTLANNGPSHLSSGAIGLQKMSVIADSFVGGTCNMYAIASQYGRYDFALNGHTLTKISRGDFNFYTPTVQGGGEFVAEGGILRLFDLKLNSGDSLVLTAKAGATLTLENNNKGGGIQIAGTLDVVNEGTVYFEPACTVRNYTHKGTLSKQGVTVNGLLTIPVSGTMGLPSKVTLGSSASLAIEGEEGSLALGEARPTLVAVPAGVTIDVSAGGAESLAGKIQIPTTLTSAPSMTVSGSPVTPALEDGMLVIDLAGGNTITLEAGETMVLTQDNLPSDEVVVVVPTGATLDVHGIPDVGCLIVLSGGTLKNSGNAISQDYKGCWNITLTADSTIDASSNFGSIAAGHGLHEVHLDGHILTKTGANSFWFANTKFTGGGALNVAEGSVRFFGGLSKEDNTTVNLTVAANATVELVSRPVFATMTGEGLVKLNFTETGYYNEFPYAQGFGGGITVEILGTQTGYFRYGSYDVNVLVSGSFTFDNGYSYNNGNRDQATYLASISGEGTLAKASGVIARPLICAPMANFTGTVNEDTVQHYQPYYLVVNAVNYYSIDAAVATATGQTPKLKEIPVVGAIPAETEIPDGWHVRGSTSSGYRLSAGGFTLSVR